MNGAGLMCQSSREPFQAPKAVEWNKRKSKAASCAIEDSVEVAGSLTAPQEKRPEGSSNFKERIVATKVKAFATVMHEKIC